MSFDEAERKFRELQARVQRGEPISRADYEAMVAELAVQDDRGVLWEINPRTGKWMYFDGAEWVVGRPPGRDQSTVIPVAQAVTPPPGATPPPMPRSQMAPPTGATPPPMPTSQLNQQRASGNTPPPMPKSQLNQPTRPSGATPPPQPRPGASPAISTSTPPPESVQEGSAAPGGVQRAFRSSAGGGGNREWIPLAIGAVVLLFCAVALFVGAYFFGNNNPFVAAKPTASRTLPRPTSTSVPPTIALPTATPVPPTPVPVVAKVTATTGNVRATAATNGKIVTTLKKGADVTLVGRSEDNKWYQINVAGQPQPAWIAAEVIQISSGDPKTLPVPGAGPAATPTKSSSIAPPPTTAAQISPASAQASPTPTVIGGPTATPTPTLTPSPTKKP